MKNAPHVTHKYKIIFFSGGYHFSGAPRALWEIIKGLDPNKYDINVVMWEESLLTDLLHQAGVKVEIVPQVKNLFRPGWLPIKIIRRIWVNLDLTRLLYQYLRKEKPDLIYFNNLEPRYAILACKLNGLPIIWHLREYRFDKLRQVFFSKLINWTSQKIVLSSKGIKEIYFSNLKDDSRLRLIYDGVDLDLATKMRKKPAPEILEKKEPKIGFFGFLNPAKGAHILIEAVNYLKSEFPNLLCVIVGPKDLYHEKYFDWLHNLVHQKELKHYICFLGFQHNVFCIMDKMDLVVVPSFSESLSLVILEAMALEKPVVASRVGGTPESVSDDKTGKLILPGNPKILAEEIGKILKDKKKGQAWGQEGRKKVESYFRIETYRQRVGQVIEETLLEGKRKKEVEREKN